MYVRILYVLELYCMDVAAMLFDADAATQGQ